MFVSSPSRPRSRAVIGLVLLTILLLPPLFFYLAVASSLALGASIAALIVIAALGDPAAIQRFFSRFTLGRPTVLAVMIVAGITAHAAIASLFLRTDLMRAGASIVPLVLLLFSGYALGRTLAASRHADVDGAVRLCFWVFCVIALLALTGFAPGNSAAYYKPVFPFTEPSYFALAFTPLLMYCSLTATGARGRILILLTGVCAALLLQNLTLLLGCLLITYISFRRSVVVILLIGAALVASQLDLSYYIERLDLSGETQNLSSLVYLQGWQLVAESLTRSNGWGLGFQQLGVYGTDAPIANLIYDLTSGYSNLLDGGFTFAKLLSEFGTLGLLLTLLYLLLAWRAVRALRQTARAPRRAGAALTLSRCVIVSYLLELFVRGSGYFAGTTILLVASLSLVSAELPQHVLRAKPALGR
jgi:hypothetical protein